jgi:hypothetical protein
VRSGWRHGDHAHNERLAACFVPYFTV